MLQLRQAVGVAEQCWLQIVRVAKAACPPRKSFRLDESWSLTTTESEKVVRAVSRSFFYNLSSQLFVLSAELFTILARFSASSFSLRVR